MATNNSVDFVRKILNESVKFRKVEANFSILFAACADLNLSPPVIKAGPISTAAEVRGVIERIAHRLGVNPAYSAAFDALWQARPELKLQCNENILADLVGEEISGDNLIYVAGMPDVAETLATTAEYRAEQERVNAELRETLKQADEAATLRAEMLGWFETAQKHLYKGTPSVWKNMHAREMARLDGMDLEQLRYEAATRREKRRIATMSNEERRAEIRKQNLPREQALYTDRYPVLPPEIYLPNSLTKIPMDRETLLRISQVDREHFRILVQKYGSAQIDARLQGI